MTVSARREALILVLTLLATALLHLPTLLQPCVMYDDFDIIRNSWDWPTTRDNLWAPHNEHAMPLGRLAAWAVINADQRQDSLPWRTSWQGPLAAVFAAAFIYVFVRRELGRPFPALLAAVLYGVSLKYHETATWYAASFWLLGFDTILLALLAAQSARLSRGIAGRAASLVLCVLLCFAAPCWYAGGILAGPLCVLYLLPQSGRGWAAWRGRLLALVPVLGSVLFLAVSLPQNYDKIMHTEHYQGRTAKDVFDPLFGLACTGRAVVDVLFFNPTGKGLRSCPPPLVPLILAVLAVLTAWWNWRAARPWFAVQSREDGACGVLPWWDPRVPYRLVVLGLGLIGLHYVLTFSPRSLWSYDGQMVNWTRYHMVPWFGMVLLIVNGLAPRAGEPAAAAELTRGKTWGLAITIMALLTVQFPVAWFIWQAEVPKIVEQRHVLRRIAEVDEKCRANHVSAADARAVLDPLDFPMARGLSPWEWLRGSDRPQPHTPEEVRRLLDE